MTECVMQLTATGSGEKASEIGPSSKTDSAIEESMLLSRPQIGTQSMEM